MDPFLKGTGAAGCPDTSDSIMAALYKLLLLHVLLWNFSRYFSSWGRQMRVERGRRFTNLTTMRSAVAGTQLSSIGIGRYICQFILQANFGRTD